MITCCLHKSRENIIYWGLPCSTWSTLCAQCFARCLMKNVLPIGSLLIQPSLNTTLICGRHFLLQLLGVELTPPPQEKNFLMIHRACICYCLIKPTWILWCSLQQQTYRSSFLLPALRCLPEWSTWHPLGWSSHQAPPTPSEKRGIKEKKPAPH